jgi:hypothetical protein
MFESLRPKKNADPLSGEPRDDDADRYVPASARNSERMRIARYLGEEPPDDDEDLAFIAEVARAARAQERPAAPAVWAADAADEEGSDERLQIFRELPRVYERPAVMEVTDVHDIDLGELLDSLATTAAALRLRRAA